MVAWYSIGEAKLTSGAGLEMPIFALTYGLIEALRDRLMGGAAGPAPGSLHSGIGTALRHKGKRAHQLEVCDGVWCPSRKIVFCLCRDVDERDALREL